MGTGWRRVAPLVLAGVLLLNIAAVIAAGSRWNWLAVAFVVLVLALNLRRQRRVDQEPKDPHQQ